MIDTKKLNTTADAMRSRVSIRRYTDAPVPQEDVLEAIELAGNAPSAFNLQPWRFHVVRDSETKSRLQAAAMNQAQVGAAPVLLVLTSDMEDVMANLEDVLHPGLPEEKRVGTKGYLESMFGGLTVQQRAEWGRNQTNIALGYLLVALESMGYGSSPMLGFDADAVRAVLGLPQHVEIVALVSIGHPAEEGFPKHRHPVETILRAA
ncbi:nitroreductase family protein [Fimbriimonas ginsengisoli]|uniref:NADH dehydrogenase n=1 Tax=Fimbriimonas ginsengisoli Gsoil 348 TaxID=661478 RepID=A0A068NKY7_FIMGI|nr:nitroreductase family protein [Fimbriimonas ginsengisoli]AIE84067.1 NADH dehydrogenase [Fimbriimonas ginsengisoli Gsoil 348]